MYHGGKEYNALTLDEVIENLTTVERQPVSLAWERASSRDPVPSTWLKKELRVENSPTTAHRMSDLFELKEDKTPRLSLTQQVSDAVSVPLWPNWSFLVSFD